MLSAIRGHTLWGFGVRFCRGVGDFACGRREVDTGMARCEEARGRRALEITRRISVAPPPAVASRRARNARTAASPLSANYSQSTDVLVVGLGL